MSGVWEAEGPDLRVHEGFLSVIQRRYRLPDGRSVSWELLDIPEVTAVLALTPERTVVMVRQFRAGPARRVLSIPGGLVDPGEDPLAAAARELLEETGYAAGRLEHAGTVQLNNFTRPQHVAIAYDCIHTQDQTLDEFEDCEVVLMELAEVRKELKAGRLGAGLQTYLALDHLDLL
ncbi:MAG: NUDIX hydrolase [Nocardioides sp.]